MVAGTSAQFQRQSCAHLIRFDRSLKVRPNSSWEIDYVGDERKWPVIFIC